MASFNPDEPRDRVVIRPCWTPEAWMPSASASLSAQDESSPRQDLRDRDGIILLPWIHSSATASSRFLQRFFSSENGNNYWAEWMGAQERRIANDYGILPGQVSLIRRAKAEAANFFIAGGATSFDFVWSIPVPEANDVLEYPFSLTEPRSVALRASGLESVFRPSVSASERLDELIVWENQTGFYLRPAQRFYLQDASPDPVWRALGDTTTNQGNFMLKPTVGYTIHRRGIE